MKMLMKKKKAEAEDCTRPINNVTESDVTEKTEPTESSQKRRIVVENSDEDEGGDGVQLKYAADRERLLAGSVFVARTVRTRWNRKSGRWTS